MPVTAGQLKESLDLILASPDATRRVHEETGRVLERQRRDDPLDLSPAERVILGVAPDQPVRRDQIDLAKLSPHELVRLGLLESKPVRSSAGM